MNPAVRIIPKLDIKGLNLVKGIHLEGLRVLGKLEDFAEYYYESGADELIYTDVVASLYERNSLYNIISKTTKSVNNNKFMYCAHTFYINPKNEKEILPLVDYPDLVYCSSNLKGSGN